MAQKAVPVISQLLLVNTVKQTRLPFHQLRSAIYIEAARNPKARYNRSDAVEIETLADTLECLGDVVLAYEVVKCCIEEFPNSTAGVIQVRRVDSILLSR